MYLPRNAPRVCKWGGEVKAPFPWFGGKRRVAPEVWAALGDVDNYAEPFAGSLAVLLERPAWHTGNTETVNDADQYIANFWRALTHDPDAVAHYADWPVNETDLFARHLWLVNEGKRQMHAGMEADPDWYDARIAGWWVWGVCAWIGSGWCSGTGPHTYADTDAGVGETRQRPHLGNNGQGVNRKRPHLPNAGRGVVRQMRHLSDKGQGVNRQLPFVGNAGRGVHRAQGVSKQLPHIAASARRVQTRQTSEALFDYMHELAARLRQVRVCCGDWSRIVTNGALSYGATVGIFLDPPYSDAAERTANLYAVDNLDVAYDVRAWCIANGDNPRYRIVLAGYEDEHGAHMPSTWRKVSYSAGKAYGSSQSANGLNDANRHKERLWFSPHCLTPQPTLFALEVTP
jgi:hypothetical protein